MASKGNANEAYGISVPRFHYDIERLLVDDETNLCLAILRYSMDPALGHRRLA